MANLDWYLRANLKLRHLHLLVALDEMRNVGRVACHMHITQPAVSKMLSTMEEGLELKLFERTPQGLEPTEHGLCLIKHARIVLAEMVQARDALRDISEGKTSRVSLGVLPASAMVLIPEFIGRLEAASTSTSVTVREDATDRLLAMLQTGDLDLIVSNVAACPIKADFVSERLYFDPLVVVVRKDHPLTQIDELDIQSLNDYPMVLPPEYTSTRSIIDNHLIRNKVSISKRYVESVSTNTNIGVLQCTESTGFLSLEVARYYESLGVLSILPIDLGGIGIDVGLVWMADRGLTKAQKLVRTLFKETAESIAQQATARFRAA